MKAVLQTLFFFLLITQISFTQQNFWEQTSGPPAGYPNYLVMNSQGHIFHEMDGGYVYRSTDHGLSWKELTNGLDRLRYSSITIDKKDYIFVGALWYGGIFLSTDNGESWTRTTFPYRSTMQLAIDSAGGLLAATYDDYLGIFRSTDNGETWTSIGPTTGHKLNSLAVSKNGTIFTGVEDVGLYRSTDNGSTWTLTDINFRVNDIAFNSKDDVYVLKGYGYGTQNLYVSTDNGTNWNAITTCPPLYEEGSTYTSMEFDFEDNVFIAGSRDYANIGPGVYLSTDSCSTWEKISDLDCLDLLIDQNQNLLLATVNAGIVLSTDMGDSWQYPGPSISRVLSLSFSPSNLLIAGLDYYGNWPSPCNAGIFYSMNGGNTWKPAGLYEKSVQAVCSNGSTSILAGTSDGVYYLPDLDSSWVPSGLPNTSILCLERSPNGNVFAGTVGSGLYLSSDNGISWSFVGLLNKSIRSIMTEGLQTIYAGTENEGVYSSIDGGINWQFLGLANTTIASLVQAGIQIFAATNSGIYKSTDNGNSWSFAGLNGESVQDLLVSSINYIYAATSENGVYYSENYGQSWIQLISGLNYLNVKSLAIDSNEFLYAGTDYGGVYRSNLSVPVEFTSFTAISNGKEVTLNWSTATELNNLGFEIQRSTEGKEFFTVGFVNGHGTTTEQHIYSYADRNLDNGTYNYRLKQVDYDGSYEYSDVIEVEWRAFNSYLLEQNYPNPFNPTTTIGFGLQNKSDVKITILNAIGEEVAVLLNEEREAGFHQVEFNAVSLPSGVYFYQLRAGEFIQTKKMILLK